MKLDTPSFVCIGMPHSGFRLACLLGDVKLMLCAPRPEGNPAIAQADVDHIRSRYVKHVDTIKKALGIDIPAKWGARSP